MSGYQGTENEAVREDNEVVEEVERGQIDDIPSPSLIMEERPFVPTAAKIPLPKGMIVTPMEEIVVTEITG